jgi:hypothetical protein
MPWGEGPGALPPMRAVRGSELVRMAVEAHIHEPPGADELEREEMSDAWHTFADLMRDVADCAAELGACDRVTLASAVDAAIADLQSRGARVLAGVASRILYVAVVPAGSRHNLPALFAQQ